MSRTFTASPAVRGAMPLLIGLQGPSGGGKTRSALRLATGIQRVTGGEIYYVDTESGRALHYADKYKFQHVPFSAPFGSLDYLEVLEFVASKRPGVTVVDSLSHEHEGPGGYLEFHDKEVARIAAEWRVAPPKAQLPAWGKPAAARQRLINSILQMPGNFIFCFRSKEKLKLVTGEDPVQLGWMPISGDAFMFEMTLSCLLEPGAKGVPTWTSSFPGENMMIKNPDQFAWLYSESKPLDEDTGERLARWAAGEQVQPTSGGVSNSAATSEQPDARSSRPAERAEPSSRKGKAEPGNLSASPHEVQRLCDLLRDQGVGTSRLRLNWCARVLKEAVAIGELAEMQLTQAQLAKCLAAVADGGV